MVHLLRSMLVALLLLGAVGCGSEDGRPVLDLSERLSAEELAAHRPAPRPDTYLFGFDARNTPEEDARQYLPFLGYLQHATGYRFELRFTPKDGEVAVNLGRGVLHFAAIGAGSFIRARESYPIIPLARGIGAEGQAGYRSLLVTRPDTPLRGVADLRGRRLGFGSRDSTQGHIIPRIVLDQHGLSLDDLAGYIYFGSHAACANGVVTKQVDACGMQDTLARRMAERGGVRIIHASEFYPSSGIAAHGDVPAEVIEAVRRALIDFRPTGRDAAGLYHWEMTEMPNGFVPATDADYDELARWAKRLGLMERGDRS